MLIKISTTTNLKLSRGKKRNNLIKLEMNEMT